MTRAFFMICCKDENTHLHVLARLVRMLDGAGRVDQLLECECPMELEELLAHWEMAMIMH